LTATWGGCTAFVVESREVLGELIFDESLWLYEEDADEGREGLSSFLTFVLLLSTGELVPIREFEFEPPPCAPLFDCCCLATTAADIVK
jgi:hypothetical protein